MIHEATMSHLLWNIWREENGQDLIEYTLLIFFVMLVTAGVMNIGGQSIKGIVSTSNSEISAANVMASS
jgi:Flp pilus assembly pilin Flp